MTLERFLVEKIQSAVVGVLRSPEKVAMAVSSTCLAFMSLFAMVVGTAYLLGSAPGTSLSVSAAGWLMALVSHVATRYEFERASP